MVRQRCDAVCDASVPTWVLRTGVRSAPKLFYWLLCRATVRYLPLHYLNWTIRFSHRLQRYRRVVPFAIASDDPWRATHY